VAREREREREVRDERGESREDRERQGGGRERWREGGLVVASHANRGLCDGSSQVPQPGARRRQHHSWKLILLRVSVCFHRLSVCFICVCAFMLCWQGVWSVVLVVRVGW
jgi:hypothetical protein